MKKKLQLKREIVSILDRRQMQYLTKGGEIYTKNCTGSKAKTCILDTKVVNCGTLTSYTCPTEKIAIQILVLCQEKQMDVYYELKVLHVLMKPKVFALLQ